MVKSWLHKHPPRRMVFVCCETSYTHTLPPSTKIQKYKTQIINIQNAKHKYTKIQKLKYTKTQIYQNTKTQTVHLHKFMAQSKLLNCLAPPPPLYMGSRNLAIHYKCRAIGFYCLSWIDQGHPNHSHPLPEMWCVGVLWEDYRYSCTFPSVHRWKRYQVFFFFEKHQHTFVYNIMHGVRLS